MSRFVFFALSLLFQSGTLLAWPFFNQDDVSALFALKRAIYEDPLSRLSDWNENDADPCRWFGVRCSGDRVIALKLSNSSLKGYLPPELASLSSLQECALDNNLFLGSIPAQIGMLTSLNLLDFSNNQIYGSIPTEIGDLVQLTKLDLSSNMLTGIVPTEIGNLVNLAELKLNSNKLSGALPGSNSGNMTWSSANRPSGLCRLTQLRDASFAENYFAGEVPSCLQRLPKSSFQGNCFHGSSFMPRSSPQCTHLGGGLKNSSTNSEDILQKKKMAQPVWLLLLEIATAVLIIAVLVTYTITYMSLCSLVPRISPRLRRRTMHTEQTVILLDDELLKDVPKIQYKELEVACEDFSNIIGSSSDTVVYRGTMKEGQEIAVVSLCVSRDCWTSYLEVYFHQEASELARLNHQNVVKLVGYCKESDPFSRMLVFEYALNGTLHEHLHDSEEGFQFSWQRRIKIALGIARGLKYLHNDQHPPIPITGLSSSSVYLTEDFSPKLADFERWKCTLSKPGMNSGCIVKDGGTFHGVMDSLQRRLTDIQANTFAFGGILLELITGRTPFSEDSGYLVDWAQNYLEREEDHVKLLDGQLKNVKRESLSKVCKVVKLCIDQEPAKRPTMQMIASMLEDEVETSAAALLKDGPLAWTDADIS